MNFDKYGIHNGLPKLQERLENGLWANFNFLLNINMEAIILLLYL
jgi:hypothetical protein